MTQHCRRFAELMARKHGMTYAQATKKYPRGPTKNTCYFNDYETVEAHCTHCARVEAMMNSETEKPLYIETPGGVAKVMPDDPQYEHFKKVYGD